MGFTSLLAFETPRDRSTSVSHILAYNMISSAFTFYSVDVAAKKIEDMIVMASAICKCIMICFEVE